MPVIQTSAGPGDFVSVFVSIMGKGLLRKADLFGLGLHVSAQIGIWEWDVAERERRVAPQFAADADLRRGNGKPRAFVNDADVYFEQVARADETPHLGFL